MNLPHLAPILFAKKIIEKNEKSARVECEFPYPPSLPMLLEAAAQSSVALNTNDKKEGFLVAASSLKLHKKVENQSVEIQVNAQMQMGNMHLFSFEVKNIAEGKFTVYVND
ncbi:hypothetical protein [Sulfurospirillum arcachonense]|uniref:hypothetical protein n=1 Tax=Sulfurospirillum arcachonense TaxID=57666 RepID=UPI000468F219|nr:hypothetical protein [Sulfurospirillum arcachonense]